MGSAPCIDAESDKNLRALATAQGDSRPSKATMVKCIVAEALETHKRRAQDLGRLVRGEELEGGEGLPPTASDCDPAPSRKYISANSIRKYLQMYGFL